MSIVIIRAGRPVPKTFIRRTPSLSRSLKLKKSYFEEGQGNKKKERTNNKGLGFRVYRNNGHFFCPLALQKKRAHSSFTRKMSLAFDEYGRPFLIIKVRLHTHTHTRARAFVSCNDPRFKNRFSERSCSSRFRIPEISHKTRFLAFFQFSKAKKKNRKKKNRNRTNALLLSYSRSLTDVRTLFQSRNNPLSND